MKRILENLSLSVIESMQNIGSATPLTEHALTLTVYLGDVRGTIPEFMEIEAETPGLIFKYAELLGFKKELLPWSTTQLIQHYSRNKGKQKSREPCVLRCNLRFGHSQENLGKPRFSLN